MEFEVINTVTRQTANCSSVAEIRQIAKKLEIEPAAVRRVQGAIKRNGFNAASGVINDADGIRVRWQA